MSAMWSVLFYTGLVIAAFYFILLQPVLKKQKERRKAAQSLQIGDEIVTTGGLIGEVVDVVTPPDAPTEVILQLAPGLRVRALTEAIDRRLTTLEPASEAAQGSGEDHVSETVAEGASTVADIAPTVAEPAAHDREPAGTTGVSRTRA